MSITINVPFSIIAITAVVVIAVLVRFFSIGLYIVAKTAGITDVSPAVIMGMRLRRVPPERVIIPLIAAVKCGIPITANRLETQYLAGGNVDRVVQALIFAKRNSASLSVDEAMAIDLAGRNVLEEVQFKVYPKVGDTPGVVEDAKL